MSKIKVLVLPSDRTGVGKFRSIDPHTFLQKLYPDDFHVDINYEPPVNDDNFWKEYPIVHFHRTIGGNYDQFKKLIEPLNSSYSVDNLKPVRYFNKKSKKEEVGFIAHEVQESFPYLVTGEKDGEDLQTVNYIGLIGILTKEIQILKAEVAELKKAQK